MARRFGSAMISNTDSIPLIYSIAHIPVKVYTKKFIAARHLVGYVTLSSFLLRLACGTGGPILNSWAGLPSKQTAPVWREWSADIPRLWDECALRAG